MKTTDFTNTVTSAKLKENLEKRFGTNVNLTKYNREQLEDIRNKFRTKIFQQEGSAGINDLLANETYQKDKAMLELLNTRIKEMLGENLKQLKNKMIELSEAKKAKPDFLDMDKDGNKKEPMKKAIKDKKVDEAFPTVASARAEHEKTKTTGKFDKKSTSTGDVYTRKSKDLAGGTEDERRAAKTMKSKKTGKAVAEESEYGRAGMNRPWGNRDPKNANSSHAEMAQMQRAYAEKMKAAGQHALAGRAEAIAKEHDQLAKQEPGMAEGLKGKQTKLDVDKDGKLEKSDFAALRAKKKVKESLDAFKHNVQFVNESIGYLLQEDEEGKAKAITAAGDMVNDFTSWMQRVGQYQTKSMIELADAIRADFGPAEAEAFKQSIGPALSATLEVLTQQREVVSNAVATLAGEAVPEEPMGMEPAMPPETGMDMSEPDTMNPEPEDEFGASDAAAGMGTTGREMRESREQVRARKLAESHSIMSKLSR